MSFSINNNAITDPSVSKALVPIEQNAFSTNSVMHPNNLQLLWDKSIKQHEQACNSANTVLCLYCFLIKIPQELRKIINEYDAEENWYYDFTINHIVEECFLRLHPDKEAKPFKKFLLEKIISKNANGKSKIKYNLLGKCILMQGIVHFFFNFSKAYWDECLTQCNEEHLAQSDTYQNWMLTEHLSAHFPKHSEIIETINSYVKQNYIFPKFKEQIKALFYCSYYQFKVVKRLVKACVISETDFIKGAHVYFKRIAIEYSGGFILMPIRYRVRSYLGEKVNCPVRALISMDPDVYNWNLDCAPNLVWVIDNNGNSLETTKYQYISDQKSNESLGAESDKAEFYLLHNEDIFFISLKKGLKTGTELTSKLHSTIWDIDSDQEQKLKKKKLTKNTLLIAQVSWGDVKDIP